MTSFAQSTATHVQCEVSALFSISDAEPAYPSALKSAFAATDLMCYFHVKHAAKKSLYKRFRGEPNPTQSLP